MDVFFHQDKFKNFDKIQKFCLEGDLNPPSLVFQDDTQIREAFQILGIIR